MLIVRSLSGPYLFKISGELHHLAGAILPLLNQAPVFAQVYIYDPQQQLALREGHNDNLSPAIMTVIQGVLNQSHPYVKLDCLESSPGPHGPGSSPD